jgi:hypothetical protein
MTTVARRLPPPLNRDNYIPILGFLPTPQESALAARICRAARNAFLFAILPKIESLHLKGARLVSLSQTSLRFTSLASLTISELGHGHHIPLTFNQPTIYELRIGRNVRLPPGGLERLVNALAQVQILRIYALCDNICFAPEHCPDATRKLSHLRVLEIFGTSVDADSIQELLASSSEVTRAYLNMGEATASLMSTLRELPQLQELTLICNRGVRYDRIRELANLRKFSMPHVMDPEILATIIQTNRLTLTHLAVAVCPDSVLRNIGALRELQYLQLHVINSTSDFSALRTCPKLTHLEVQKLYHTVNATSEKAATFVQSLPPLTTFVIEDLQVWEKTVEFFSTLSQSMPQLETLVISAETYPYTDGLTTEIAKLGKLRKLWLGFNDGLSGQQVYGIVSNCSDLAVLSVNKISSFDSLTEVHTLIQNGHSRLTHFVLEDLHCRKSVGVGKTPTQKLEEWRRAHCPTLPLQFRYDFLEDLNASSGETMRPRRFWG